MLLEVKNLNVNIMGKHPVVNDVTLSIKKGEVIGIIGESGSGKSMTAKAIFGLLPKGAQAESGSIMYDNRNLLEISEKEISEYLGRDFGMVFQNPMTSLNPLYKINHQIAEVIIRHNPIMKKEDVSSRVISLLKKVRLPDPEITQEKYPHELSGGQRQRVLIAIAIANNPQILIADEATTALDVTVQYQIIRLLKSLLKENDMSMIFISHNLGLVNHVADYIYIVYCGQIIESGYTKDIFRQPLHPYTKGLIMSLPEFAQKGTPIPVIPGRVPALEETKENCPFYPRCSRRTEACNSEVIELKPAGDNHFVSCIMTNQ